MVVLFLPSGAKKHDRVLVVLLDAAVTEHIDTLASRGTLPTLGALRTAGYRASLVGGSARVPREYWRAVLGGRAARERPGDMRLWADLAQADRRTVLVNVPVELVRSELSGSDVSEGLAGADERTGFVGDSTGRVENASVVTRGRVEWPYREASREIVDAVEELDVDAASDWIDVQQPQPDSRRGKFRIYRLDEDSYYLTAVYRRTQAMPAATVTSPSSKEGAPELYVADDASYAAASTRVLDYLPVHAADVSRDRAEAARRLATGGWDVMVYYESLLATVYGIHEGLLDSDEEGGAPTAGDLAAEYAQVDAQIGRMLEAAGPGTLLVVLTRDAATAVSGADVTGLMLVGGDGASISAQAEVASIYPTLLALAAVEVRSSGPAHALYAVSSRNRSNLTPASVDRSDALALLAFQGSAQSLERLGALEASATIPVDEDVEAKASN